MTSAVQVPAAPGRAVSDLGVFGSISPDPDVPDDVVADALTRGARDLRYVWDLVDDDGDVVGPVDVAAGTVKHADLADVKRTVEVSLRDDRGIDYVRHRLRPSVRLVLPGGTGYAGRKVTWRLGVFVMAAPKRKLSLREGASLRDVTCYDRGLVLRDDKVRDRYTVRKGVPYLEAVSDVLASAGLQAFGISGADEALPAALEWEPGTSKGRIVDDLLAAINYRPLTFDGEGRPRAVAYESPAEAAPVWTYEPSTRSVLLPDIDEDFDVSGVPNVFVLVVSAPDRAELRAEYVNADPASPTSTVSVGRAIVDYRLEQDAADQATLDAKVKRIAEEASQVYATLRFTTGAMPFHDTGDVVLADVGEGLARYRETEWSLPMLPGAQMSHSVRRVVVV